MEGTAWLTGSLIYLAAAVVAVPLARLLGLGSIIGYLVAGIVIGPWGLRLVTDPQDMLHFAEFGVVLMLFLIGLELDPQRLWSLRKPIFGWGSVQLFGSAALMACGALLLGIDWHAGAGRLARPRALVDGDRRRRAGRAQPAWYHLGPERAERGAAAGRGRDPDPGTAAADRCRRRARQQRRLARRAACASASSSRSCWAAACCCDRPCAGSRAATARDLHRRGAVARGRDGRADAGRRPVDGARRLPRRRAARRKRIPARARDRHRALQGPAARPLLHRRRHEHRLRGGAGPAASHRRDRARLSRREGRRAVVDGARRCRYPSPSGPRLHHPARAGRRVRLRRLPGRRTGWRHRRSRSRRCWSPRWRSRCCSRRCCWSPPTAGGSRCSRRNGARRASRS